MIVKLYNHSKLPDPVLKPLLERAAKAMQCKGPVVVRVSKGFRGGGHFAPYRWIARHAVARTQFTKAGEYRKGYVPTFGYIELTPCLRHWMKPADSAERMFMTMLHEFAHCHDYQHKTGGFGDYHRHWKNRPHERRAVEMAHRARIQKLTPGDGMRLAAQLQALADAIAVMRKS